MDYKLNRRFKITIGDCEDRANTDKIHVPLTPNQITALMNKLVIIDDNDENDEYKLFSIFNIAMSEWESIS